MINDVFSGESPGSLASAAHLLTSLYVGVLTQRHTQTQRFNNLPHSELGKAAHGIIFFFKKGINLPSIREQTTTMKKKSGKGELRNVLLFCMVGVSKNLVLQVLSKWRLPLHL